VERAIDAPPRVYSTSRQAARWVGIPLSTFRQEAERHPELLPATRFGRTVRYHWMDLVTYAHVRARLSEAEDAK
jgi:hypothetical protein